MIFSHVLYQLSYLAPAAHFAADATDEYNMRSRHDSFDGDASGSRRENSMTLKARLSQHATERTRAGSHDLRVALNTGSAGSSAAQGPSARRCPPV